MITLTQAKYRQMKSALTRAINSKDTQKIIRTATEALEYFEEAGYPDDWSRWERAKQDAEWKQARS